MNNLLISEPPLQVLPSLAKKLDSVDKAIILQQIHYWLIKSNNVKDSYKWVYNTVSEWHNQFPWLSEKTVQRYLKDLENRGLLVTSNYNKAKFDRTKWYRIDYDALDNLGKPLGPTVPTKGTGSPQPKGPADLSNTNRLPETNNRKSSSKESSDIFTEYQMTGATLSNNNMLVLMDYETRLGDELVLHAIGYMDEHATKPNFNYLRKIFNAYETGDVTNVEKAKEIEKAWTNKNKNKGNYQRSTKPKHHSIKDTWDKEHERKEKLKQEYLDKYGKVPVNIDDLMDLPNREPIFEDPMLEEDLPW